jgi:ATP phosphoribosyltransferase regulatory subunit
MRGRDALPPQAINRGRADGFVDHLVGPAASRRRLTDAFVEIFESWGFGFMVTPLIEPLDTIAAGVGGAQQSALFRFMDSDGALLALVGERTVSVARVVATQLREGPFPLRLCYAGPVLRNHALNAGRRRESLQAGCELLGATGLAADAECIALAAAALERGGVEHIQVDVGHADFIPGLLDSAGLEGGARDEVLAALARRDLVAVESALANTEMADAERRLLLAFPTLRGGREILDTAASGLRGERPHRALRELAELWDLLDAHAITDRVQLDLGAVRDWDYYTGPTFEVFSADSGFALGSGGRYDALLSRFGAPLPATGFVLHVDRCHDSMVRAGAVHGAPPVLRISWDEHGYAEALALARAARERGLVCACDLADGGRGDVHVGASGRLSAPQGDTEYPTLDSAVDALASRYA